MPKYWVTIEITRRAYTEVEADSTDEVRAKADQLLEEAEIGAGRRTSRK
jgi:hypothetical protein